jgi:hypothetical protein
MYLIKVIVEARRVPNKGYIRSSRVPNKGYIRVHGVLLI